MTTPPTAALTYTGKVALRIALVVMRRRPVGLLESRRSRRRLLQGVSGSRSEILIERPGVSLPWSGEAPR